MTTLLVSGSRSLLARPEAEGRVRAIVTWLLEVRGVTELVHGHARGPDRWAEAAALAWASSTGRELTVVACSPRSGEHPLLRNARMVRETRERAALRGASVLAVGFVDPASPTRGTDHTLSLASRAGCSTLRLVADEDERETP